MAFSLGRITVQSSLGEPLRAEIDVPDISAGEAASLKTSVAPPEAFQAAGLDYIPAMSGLRVSLQRRADGRSYIQLSSDRAINEPFIDMIIEASWATGRIVRDYTLLFDPPALRQAAPPEPTVAQVPAPAASRVQPVKPMPSPAPVAETGVGAPKTSPPPAVAKVTTVGTGQVSVKYGDTASAIALAAKPLNVSLDQMLVALLRTNPTAFVDENINRVKAGVIMNLPSAREAAATPAREATRIIVAQSKDFNEFRRNLASNTPSAAVVTAGRQASGSVQAKVEDKKPVGTAADKLTLSKGSINQGKDAEAKLASERSAADAATRAAEIAKNISDLSKLGIASGAAPAAPAATPATDVAVIATPAPPTSAPLAPSRTASAPLVATAPVQPAKVDRLQELIENPLIPAGAFGLIAVLAGLGFYRLRQRKRAAQLDRSYLESSVQAESFFDANGGQSVDTDDSVATGSALLYSPSQLDAAGDVDPVAEADVYLAYGRDLQAEEILQEALLANPERIAIHQKLLEIFAQRRDTKGFETVAVQALKITEHDGLDWSRICELGLSIDPSNALYLPGGQSDHMRDTASTAAPVQLAVTATVNTESLTNQAQAHQTSDSVDLDLDFSLDEETTIDVTDAGYSDPAATTSSSVVDLDFGSITEAPAPSDTVAANPTSDAVELDFEAVTEMPAPSDTAATNPADGAVDLDFGSITEAPAPLDTAATIPTSDAVESEFESSIKAPELSEAALTGSIHDAVDFTLPEPASVKKPLDSPEGAASASAANPAAPASDLGMLQFDLGSLSLDLGDGPDSFTEPGISEPEDPLATKLALAEEFSAIGDDDGARALIEEVISEASGDMKAKAQRALSNL